MMSPASGLGPGLFLSSNPRWDWAPQKWVTEGCQHLPSEGDTFSGKNSAGSVCALLCQNCQACFSPLQLWDRTPTYDKKSYERTENSLFSMPCWKLPDVSSDGCVIRTFGFGVWVFSLNVSRWPARWGRKNIINHLNEGWLSAPPIFHRSWLLRMRVWETLSVISLWEVITFPSCKMTASSLSSPDL